MLINCQVVPHCDNKDTVGGWVGMYVAGDFFGGDLVLPEVGVSCDYLCGDLVLMRSKEVMHCITKFVGARYSFVAFGHENMRADYETKAGEQDRALAAMEPGRVGSRR